MSTFEAKKNNGYRGRIVFLEDGPLSPNGGEGATYRFIEGARLFASSGYDVLFINSFRGWSDWRRLAELAEVGIRVALVHPDDFYLNADVLRTRLREFSPDFVQTKDPKMIASLIERDLLPPSTNLIFDCHDLHDETAGARELWNKELFAAMISDFVICISPEEAKRLAEYCPEKQIIFRPCSIDISIMRKPETRPTRRRLAYVGHLYYEPNEQAARWLCQEMMPYLWSKDDRIELSFFGHVPPALKTELSSHRTIFHGYVEDVVKAVSDCDVALSVVREGTGTRVKVIHYAAAATPVVANLLGLQGWAPDCGALLAERPEDIASACLHLISSPEERVVAARQLQDYLLHNNAPAEVNLQKHRFTSSERFPLRYQRFLAEANLPATNENFMTKLAHETQPWLEEMVKKGRFKSVVTREIQTGEFFDLTVKTALDTLASRGVDVAARAAGN
ncbi:glycosyltransferase [Rhizobium laguerreae]|uniref:glycosyltransferase n=1 Tax=Rhizobium laguerreae TaxID=1076926 RepID=UPI001C90B9DB|nr:glycosyltransferase [Rhizobium laguerreae]MBY3158014.1 glycosyltransferase family 4 protein [Rhizobium laguerreae]MBY3447041.1 glycosyltransferase family 4 protein [Rhizobium laguerreae]